MPSIHQRKRFAWTTDVFLTARLFFYGICCLLFPAVSFSQEIPVGTWRAHISYNTIVAVDVAGQTVYAAAPNGFMIFNRGDQSMETFNKLNVGLSGQGITDLQYDDGTGQLVIAYEDGKFDMFRNGKISSFDPTANSPITNSKRINSISINAGLAYLSTDYGIVVVDLARNEVKETWRDIGTLGSTLKIYRSTFKGDSIFLATDKGILAGDIDDNLLDFSAWKRFDTGELNAVVRAVSFFDGKVYAGVNAVGIFHYENGGWIKETFLQGGTFSSLNAGSNLYITEDTKLWRLDDDDQLVQIIDDEITRPLDADEDSDGSIWLGDDSNGLVSNTGGLFKHYLPNGPTVTNPLRLKYANKKMYLLPGGYSSTFQPMRRKGTLSYFSDGRWYQQPESVDDLTDLEFSAAGDLFISSFGQGVEKVTAEGDVTVFNEDNSTLINLNPPGDFVNVSALELSTNGLWVANYGATQPLHLLKDGVWQSFSFPFMAARYPLDLVVDFSGYIWASLNASQGGGVLVYDLSTDGHEYITDGAGGGLPNKTVRSMAVDRDGLVWIGTELGVCYFFSPSENAIRPIFENRFLLRDDKVTAIAIDGGNRKWMGTERGVWLFDPTGEKLIFNFTTENSPLVSNSIQDIEINGETGEVFFSTARGVVSFRGDATESSGFFKTVRIFPNPVTSTFTGTVGITGLATDAVVKITDVSGKLIWETRANGGTATWNVKDYNGKRAATGVYIVYATTDDGSESAVGKIAVVN
jgi:hypothetical protein